MSRSKDTSLETLAARYLRDRRGRAAIKGAPPAGRAAAKVLKPLSDKFGPGTDRLAENWKDIVGERLADWTAPEAIRGGVLYVIARGPAGTLIEADAPRILERIKPLAGRSAPARLRVRQGEPGRRVGAGHTLLNREVPSNVQERVEIDPDARLSSALNKFERARERRERGE